MKITHPSGQNYELFPGTQLEITRYNPYFNELGEQSIPISIPATQKNLQLLGYPNRADNIKKLESRLDTQIQSGAFSIVGRQAILSAQTKGNIETSFYMNDGAFYEKIEDLTLAEIFENKKLTFNTIEDAIHFMYTLVGYNDYRFGVFQITAGDYKLNAITDQVNRSGHRVFVNQDVTEEIIDGKKVTIPKGFFMTPFVKVKHVLSEVLLHLGYSLGTSLLDEAPFNEMVFLNNNIDTLVDNSINYIDLVPNITVKDLFNVIRKFNVEFIPDEHSKTVNIIRFSDAVDMASEDISKYAVSEKIVNYHHNYRQVKLQSEMINSPLTRQSLPFHNVFISRQGGLQQGTSQDQSLYLFELLSQYPTTYYRKLDGALVRDGFQGDKSFVEKLTGVGLGYYAGGPLQTEDYSFPDVMPDIKTELKITYNPTTYNYTTFPYIDSYRALRSKIVFDDGSEDEEGISDLKAMLCLFYRTNSHCVGVLNNYNNEGYKIWNYSILWNGPDGIFEKFWRSRDTLLRNALLRVNVETILPEELKKSLTPIRPIVLHNQKYLLAEMQYTAKGKTVGAMSLLSTKVQEPISIAKSATEYFREKTYRWQLKMSQTYPGIYRFKGEPPAFYPPDPTPEQFTAGGKYYSRDYDVEIMRGGTWDNPLQWHITVWLEPALY